MISLAANSFLQPKKEEKPDPVAGAPLYYRAGRGIFSYPNLTGACRAKMQLESEEKTVVKLSRNYEMPIFGAGKSES